jgi:hypothetical protein
MKQIFISHTPRDREYVERLREHLHRIGYKSYVARDSPRPGQGWELEIVDTIRKSDAVVVMVTPRATESIYVTYEWSMAIGAGVKVVPVIFRGVNAHPHLMILETFDFGAYSDEDMFWKQFMRELQRVLGDAVTPPTTAEEPEDGELGFYLVVKHGNQLEKIHRLEGGSVSLGREPHNNIQIDDAGVSRTHLRFVRSKDSYQAIDMGSTNGTMMGQDFIENVELKPGDVLRIGDNILLTFKYGKV